MWGSWKTPLLLAVTALIGLSALLFWQAPVMVRLPFGAASVMYRYQRLNVFVNGRPSPKILVYGPSLPGRVWPDLLVLEFPENSRGYKPEFMVRPAEGQIGLSNSGSNYFQNLGPWLIRSDAAGFVGLYGVKGYEGDSHFERDPNYIRFRFPERFEDYPDTLVEIRTSSPKS